MDCLPQTGFTPVILLAALAFLLLGAVLLTLSKGLRAGVAAVLVVGLVSMGAVLPADPAQAATDADACAPSAPGDDTGDEQDKAPAPMPSEVAHTVTYTATAGGNVRGEATQVVADGKNAAAVTAVADPHHHFTGWSDGVATAKRRDRAITEDLAVEAVFAVDTWTLTYSAGPGGTIGGTTPQTVDHLSDGTAVTAVPDAGFRFVRWSDGSTDNPRTDTRVHADVTVTAEFATSVYTLSYAAGPGGIIVGETTQGVPHGTDASTVRAVPDPGFHFVRWSDGSTANPRTDERVAGDATLTAEFAVNVYALSFAAGAGGSLAGETDQQVEHGDDATAVTAVPDAGHVFVRWSDGSTTNPRVERGVRADLTVTAVFTKRTYAVTYGAGTGGTVEGTAVQTIPHGDDATAVTAVPGTGFRFVRWSDGSTANPRTDTDVTGDLTVTAEFAALTYAVVHAAGPGGTLGGTAHQVVTHGTDATPVTAVADPGHHFVRWSDGSTANPRTHTGVTADVSVTAEFAINVYAVRYAAGAGGSVTGDASQDVEHGDDATAVTAVPDTGHVFVRWSDGSTANPRTDTAVVADLSVSAEFALNVHAVRYTAGPGGTVTGDASQDVEHGDDATAVTAVPDTGHVFVRWSDGSTTNPRTDTGVAGPLSVTAEFALDVHDLTYTAGSGGTLMGEATQRVVHGSDGTAVTAIAATGRHFVRWSDGSTANPRTDTGVTGDVTVTAEFAVNVYALRFSAGTGGSLTGAASQDVEHGDDSSPVTAVADTGFRFVRWSDGVTANPRTVTGATGDLTLTAEFAVRTYALTYAADTGGAVSGVLDQEVDHGSDGTPVEAVPDAGRHFVEWSDGVTANPRTDTGVTADLSVTAEFAINVYAVRYTAGAGGSLTGDRSQDVEHGDDATEVTAVPDPGRHFVRWSDGSTANPRTDLAVVADLSVTAEFAVDVHALRYAAGAGGSLTGDTAQDVEHGDDGTAVSAVPGAGRHFVEWSDGSTDNPRTDLDVRAPLSVIAVFDVNRYTVSYTAGAGGSITGDAVQTVTHDGDATAVTATPDTGYRFVRWSDGSTANPRTDTDVTDHLAVTAEFAVKTYEVTYEAGAGGTIGGTASQTVAHGSDATEVTATPDTGFRFVRWSDGSTANPRTDTDVTSDLSLTAEFAVRTYALRYAAGTGGALTGDVSQDVDHGDDGTAVTAVPDSGFRFVRWSDGVTANPRTDTGVVADVTVTAEFDDAVDLAVGQTHGGALGAGVTVGVRNSGGSLARYLLVPTHTGTAAASLTTEVTGHVPLTPSSPAGAASTADQMVAARTAQLDAFPGQQARVPDGTAPIATGIPHGVVPSVGDVWRLNRALGTSCVAGTPTDARVLHVGDHVVVVEDTTNPVPATLDAALITALDTHVAGGVASRFGALPDRDGNGRVVLFVTRGFNTVFDGAPSLAQSGAAHRVRDLLTQDVCPASNNGEVVYLAAADPTGSLAGLVRTVALTTGQWQTHTSHELVHLLDDATAVAAGRPLDGSWVAEALADAGNDAAFYAASVGLAPMGNTVVTQITTGPNASRRVVAYNTYANQSFTRYREWLRRSYSEPLLTLSGTQAGRGAGWAFLSYVVGRHADGDQAAAVAAWRTLLTSSGSEASVATLIGADVDTWFDDFVVASYVDDAAGDVSTAAFIDGPYTHPEWNFRSIFGALGGFPLTFDTIGAPAVTTALAGRGTGRVMRFDVAAGQVATVSVSQSGTPVAGVRYRIVRIS